MPLDPKFWAALLGALPEIMKLVRHLQRRIDENALNAKVKDDFEKINKAFEEKDAEALRRIFSSE